MKKSICIIFIIISLSFITNNIFAQQISNVEDDEQILSEKIENITKDQSFNLHQDEEVTVSITGNAPADLGEFETFINVNSNIDNETVYVHGYTVTTGIIFTFANDEVKIEDDDILLDFDVMIQASESGTRFGSGMVYVDYNADAFGENIYADSNITVTKGEILLGELVPGADLYSILAVVDNNASKFAIATCYEWSILPDYANELTIEPIQYLHISMCISDTLSHSGLFFDNDLMVNQQYFSDETTFYIPVIADDSLDVPLNPDTPPSPENVIIEIVGTNILITWNEVSVATSYKIYSSDDPYAAYPWNFEEEVTDTNWSEPATGSKKFYYIKALN